MSALGQKRTCALQKAMSALPPKADIGARADGSDRTRRHTPKYAGLLCTASREFVLQLHSVRHLP